MTKELLYDLEFSQSGAKALSGNGSVFLLSISRYVFSQRDIYLAAIDNSLNVRFADQQTRDQLSAISC